MKTYRQLVAFCTALLSLSLMLTGCGGSGGSAGGSSQPANTGVAKIDLTDAPAGDYSHVYVTVTGIGFHTDATAGFAGYSTAGKAGWQIVKLNTPNTVDLAQLTNGTTYAALNGNNSLFSGVTLPAGNYNQIRIFLAATEDTYAGSIAGLTYNNEVVLNGDGTQYPLRVPSAATSGIKLLPESPIVVTAGGSTSLVLDFNLAQDVIEVSPNGSKEFLMQPRLGYFDMASVGAVTGAVSFGNLSTSRITVKAEQVKSGAGYRVVRRMTGVDKTDGSFKLYPLPIFGNATTATYDLLIRGRGVETAIVKGVTVHKGTTADTGVNLGTITLQQGTDFGAQLGSKMRPSGSWLNFYQTIAGDPAPFEVESKLLDPYTGQFGQAVGLSTGSVQVATYTPGLPLAFVQDATSAGTFSAVADAAWLYDRGSAVTGITGAAGRTVAMTLKAANLPQSKTATSASITGTINQSGTSSGGQLFITNDGLVIDSVPAAVGSAVAVDSLPSAVYGLFAQTWGAGGMKAGNTQGVDLTKGSVAAMIRMK